MNVSFQKIRRNTNIDPSIGREVSSAFLLLILILVFQLPAGDRDFRQHLATPATESENSNKPREAATAESRVSFIAVGDIMLSRGVAREINRENDPRTPFMPLAELLKSTDFNFGNLESPVSGNDRLTGRGLVFNTDTRHISALGDFNFKIVSLANNHALDQGLKGLIATRSFLDRNEILYVGAGENQRQAWRPAIIDANGMKIAFIGASYTSVNDGGATTNPYVARIGDLERLVASIEEIRALSDFIVVTMHAGTEYVRKPHPSQVAFARAAIDNGADIVIGSHPHWIQTFETYRGKYIFYSLGNFIFDQRKPDTREGLVLRISVRRAAADSGAATTLEKIELIPVISDRPGVPRLATETQAKTILARIGARSSVIEPSNFLTKPRISDRAKFNRE